VKERKRGRKNKGKPDERNPGIIRKRKGSVPSVQREGERKSGKKVLL